MVAEAFANSESVHEGTAGGNRGGRLASGSEWGTMVSVGCVARAHGIAGRVIINPTTDFVNERFRVGKVFYVRRDDQIDQLVIRDVRFHGRRPIVSFAEVTTMTAAQQLASLELRVPLRSLGGLPDGMFYHHELLKCQVITADGIVVGSVAAIEDGGGACRLVVENGSTEIQVPLVKPICERIDPEAGVITINPPEGLLDLNIDGSRKPGDRTRIGDGGQG